MSTEDRYFIVSSPDGRLNIRSTAKVEDGNDLGDFDLLNNDVIHAVEVVVSGNITFHRIDRIYRGGKRYDYSFKGFPAFVVSPTGKHWVAEKVGTDLLMKDTVDPESPGAGSGAAGKKYVGWRVLHQGEGGYAKNPLNMPEVIPPENPVAINMTEAIQRMSFELMKHFNPAITPKLWTKVYEHNIAFTNYNGFGKSGDLRANYITGENLDKGFPKYDKAQRLCGGMFLRGETRSDKLVCQPGIHGIDSTRPLPDLQTIIDNNWYFYAITLYNSPSKVGHFPHGKGGPVAIPFIFDREIQFPISLFERWESDTLPEPTRLYKAQE